MTNNRRSCLYFILFGAFISIKKKQKFYQEFQLYINTRELNLFRNLFKKETIMDEIYIYFQNNNSIKLNIIIFSLCNITY